MKLRIALTFLLISLNLILAQELAFEFSDEGLSVDESKSNKGFANLLEVYFTSETLANQTAD